MSHSPRARDYRHPAHPIHDLFAHRWSPRAMSGEPVTVEEINSLLEAARWAPSSMNEQPWRILYALRGDAAWPTFFGLLNPRNQLWCANAGALLLVISKKTFTHNGAANRTHEYDAGSAWMSIALQGTSMGLNVRGMAGFDAARARTELNIPDDFTVMAMAAVGRPGDPAELEESLRKNEFPSSRKSVEEISRRGGF